MGIYELNNKIEWIGWIPLTCVNQHRTCRIINADNSQIMIDGLNRGPVRRFGWLPLCGGFLCFYNILFSLFLCVFFFFFFNFLLSRGSWCLAGGCKTASRRAPGNQEVAVGASWIIYVQCLTIGERFFFYWLNFNSFQQI